MEDKDILTSGRCLTANHINAANHLLKIQFPRVNGLQDTHYLRECQVWKADPSKFVQIVNVGSQHWVCLSNFNCNEDCVDIYDSMTSIPEEEGDVVKQACTILKSLHLDFLKINVVSVRQQVGGTDCGLFATAIATDLCLGMDPFNSAYIQDDMRLHFESCCESGVMAKFPSVDRQVVDDARRVWDTVSFELFCVCRQPEGDRMMVCCDGCDMWFHKECVLDQSVDLDLIGDWFCQSCKY